MKKNHNIKIIFSALLSAMLLFSLLGCDSKKNGPTGTEAPVGTAQTDTTEIPSTNDPSATELPNFNPTDAPEYSYASFNVNTIKEGDTVSIFKVTEKTVDENGDVKIVFSGTAPLNGSLASNGDGTCTFAYTEEFANILPFPEDLTSPVGIIISETEATDILGSSEGTFSIAIHNYTITVQGNNSYAGTTAFEKVTGDYVIID